MAPKPATSAQPIERSLRSARLIAVVWLLAVAWLLAVDWRLLKPGALVSPRDHACFAGQDRFEGPVLFPRGAKRLAMA